MFLKRLEISGFKSFAERTVLDFDNKGKEINITGIVGPNGAGKSNVVDAIRWVLGETSYKLMRSKKSEDVVFFGSQGKQKGSAAQVSMTLDNSDGHIPIDFSEVTITRKVYRSGESEYLINKAKVRLIDIHEMLSKCGFGQTTYTVLGQGMVDQLLFYGPSERKVLFDEAAGVKRYQIKREQSIKKLEATDKNLIRLKDILTELEPRVKNLERLVKRAEGRGSLEIEIKELQDKYYSALYFELDQKSKEIEEKRNVLLENIRVIEVEIANLTKEVEKNSGANPYDKEKSHLEEKLRAIGLKRESLLGQVSFISGQLEQEKNKFKDEDLDLNTLKEEEKNILEKIPSLREKISENEKEKHLLEKEIEEIANKLVKLEEKATEIDESLKNETERAESKSIVTLKSELAKKEEEKNKIIREISAEKQKQADLEYSNKRREERVHFLTRELESLESKKGDLGKSLESLTSESKISTEEILKAEKELKSLSAEIKVKEEEIREIVGKQGPEFAKEIESDLKTLLEYKEEITQSLEKKKDATDFLKKFTEGFAAFSNKVKNYLKANNLKERGEIETTLSDLREVQVKILNNINDLNFKKQKKDNEIGNISEELREIEKRVAENQRELKDLSKIEETVKDDSLSHLQLQNDRIEEEIISLNEKISSIGKSFVDKQNQLLMNKNNVQSEIALLKTENHQKEVSLSGKIHLIENQTREADQSEDRLEEVLKKIELLSKKDGTRIHVLEKSLKDNQGDLEVINENLEKEKADLNLIIEKERDYSREFFEKDRQLRAKDNEVLSLRQGLSAFDIENTRIAVKREDLGEEIERLSTPFERVEVLGNISIEERGQIRNKIESVKRRLEVIGDVDDETKEEYDELSVRYSDSNAQIEDLSNAKADLSKIIKELDGRIKEQFEVSFKTISKEFSRYFKILFGGGVADLTLERNEEENDFGIEITACPPGKRVKNLNALSGGERTLTSLALLFAILSVNPSPFVVLDEVDAALDEANTLQFLKIIEDISRKTQFIIVTHNRETMKMTNTLYGVTMDDSHVSRILSLKLKEAEKVVG